eukprot:CAMPEP_0115175522 /NCGR_PEP_ID=MMETSP0270-20121206/4401_1 /TAXON_ID=71861 /ORGANISM="Scrippsiella trochoidea, Strain CCMP3099" /LENGTH=118 /DNA_ID=CAMNT_0002588401 /DNA_START=591 /DNA_END=948 /DNA_ORIENTATION=-
MRTALLNVEGIRSAPLLLGLLVSEGDPPVWVQAVIPAADVWIEGEEEASTTTSVDWAGSGGSLRSVGRVASALVVSALVAVSELATLDAGGGGLSATDCCAALVLAQRLPFAARLGTR